MAALVQGSVEVRALIGQPPVLVGGLAVLSRLSSPYRATVDLDVVDRLLGEMPTSTSCARPRAPSRSNRLPSCFPRATVRSIELYEHWWARRSQVEISASLGLDRRTIRKYPAPAIEAELVPGRVAAGRAPMTRADWRELASAWFPQVADAGLRQVTWPVIEPHRDYIVEQLKAG